MSAVCPAESTVQNGSSSTVSCFLNYLQQRSRSFYLVTLHHQGPDGSSGVSGRGPAAGIPVVPDFRLNNKLRCLWIRLPARKGQGRISLQRKLLVSAAPSAGAATKPSAAKIWGEVCNTVHRPRREEGYRFSGDGKPRVHRHCGHPERYLPLGFNFKLEGRGLGAALVLELLIYRSMRSTSGRRLSGQHAGPLCAAFHRRSVV